MGGAVVDPGTAVGDARIRPLGDGDPVARHGGHDIIRFVGDSGEFIAAIGMQGTGWWKPIPAGTGTCGLSGDVVACATPDGNGIAIDAATGDDAPAGEYAIDSTPDTAVADDLGAPATLPNGLDAGTGPASSVDTGAGLIIGTGDTLHRVDGDRVEWSKDLPAGTGDLNAVGSGHVRWVVDGGILIIGEPDGVVALDLATGEERWRVDAKVDAWYVDDGELFVQHDGIISVYDLRTPAPADPTAPPTATLPAPPVDAVLADLDGLALLFSSGAGGWSTVSQFGADGAFAGVYTDSDATSAVRAEFHGRFEVVEQIDAHTHRLELAELVVDSPTGTTVRTTSGQTVEYVDNAYGFSEGTDFLLLAPEAPTSAVAADIADSWLRPIGVDVDGAVLGTTVLVNVAPGYAMAANEYAVFPEFEVAPEPTQAAASGYEGTWCPTPESTSSSCFTIAGASVTFEPGGEVYEVHAAPDGSIPGCTRLSAFAPVDGGGPLGSYCPVDVDVVYGALYTGDPHNGEERIFNVQTASLYLRR